MKPTYVLCPICEKHKFPIWEDNGTCICPRCGWGHDTYCEEDPNVAHGPNDLSLNEYKLRYEYYIAQNPKYYWSTDNFPEIPQIEKSPCPICGKFIFEPLTFDDLYCGVTPSKIFCLQCGWHYDEKQIKNPILPNGANTLSLNDYKKWYQETITDDPYYNYFEEITKQYKPKPHLCPICGKHKFKDLYSHGICPFCGWEDDGHDTDDPSIGANDLSFCKYKERYQKLISDNPNYKWKNNAYK